MTNLLFRFFPALDRYCADRARYHFFQEIAEHVCTPPGAIDKTFNHAQYYRLPLIQPFGMRDHSLVIVVDPIIHGHQCRMFYSLWLTGDKLKIGVVMDNETALAPVVEGQQEMGHIWDDMAPEVQDRDGMVMYQWSFDIPDMLDRWLARERFVDGVRHMHIRLLRILHDGLAGSLDGPTSDETSSSLLRQHAGEMMDSAMEGER